MSKRKEVFVKTAMFCDVPGCTNEAYGPCAICGDDVCYGHGDGNRGLTLKGLLILVCPKHTGLLSVLSELAKVDTSWQSFEARKIDKNAV